MKLYCLTQPVWPHYVKHTHIWLAADTVIWTYYMCRVMHMLTHSSVMPWSFMTAFKSLPTQHSDLHSLSFTSCFSFTHSRHPIISSFSPSVSVSLCQPTSCFALLHFQYLWIFFFFHTALIPLSAPRCLCCFSNVLFSPFLTFFSLSICVLAPSPHSTVCCRCLCCKYFI